jgi:hypothetical protein
LTPKSPFPILENTGDFERVLFKEIYRKLYAKSTAEVYLRLNLLRKIVTLIAVLILAVSSIFLIKEASTQPIMEEAPSLQWLKTYGTYGSDSVIQTSDGGYAIVGANATHTVHGYGTYWPILIKADASGELQWSKGYLSPSFGSFANSVIQTEDGGFFLCGQGDWILKVNTLGDIIWNKTLGLDVRDYVNLFAIPSSDGSFIVAGTMSNSTTGGNDALIVKLDQNGNALWKQVFSINSMIGPLSIFASSITETSDNSYVLVGEWNNHPWLVKTDYLGNLLVNRTYRQPDLLGFNSVIADSDDELTITAYNVQYTNQNTINTAWFLKANGNGTLTLNRSYNDSRPFKSLKKTSDGYIALEDTSLVKFSSFGELQHNISLVSIGLPSAFVETENNNYVVTGISSTNEGLQTIFLAKISFENNQNPRTGPFRLTSWQIVIMVAVVITVATIAVILYRRRHIPSTPKNL